MKPDFALSLSFEGLRLLMRAPEGWLLVGEVALDSADLSGALAALRNRGEALAGGPFATKLVLPNEQIKYIALDTTRTDEDDVRAALHGATPYALDDLAYDFAKGGGRTYIAAVARETLAEAEAFAREHGFTPAGFVAIPAPFTFVGEPVFGALDGVDAEALKDPDPIVVVGSVPDALQDDAAPDAPETAEDAVTQVDPAPAEPSRPEEPSRPAASAHDAPPRNDPADDTALPDAGPPGGAATATDAPVFGSTRDPDAPARHSAGPAFGDDADPATDPRPVDTSAPSDRPPAPMAEAEAPPVFGTRRSGDIALAAVVAPRRDPPPLAVPVRTPDHGPRLGAADRSASDDIAPAPLPGAAPPDPAASAPPISGIEVPDSAPPVPTPDPAEAAEAPAALAATLAPADPAAAGGFRSRRKPEPASADATAAPKQKSFFNARRKAPEPKVVGGKPRFLGLILTAALILVLLLIGLFMAGPAEVVNSLFRRNAVPDAPQPQAVASAPVAPEAPAAAPASQPDLAAAPEALAPQVSAPRGPVLSPDEAERIYAATGVWQRAPRLPVEPRIDPMGEIALAAIPAGETARLAQPQAPLPDGLFGDTIFPAPVAPPPPEAAFDYDETGYVVATPEGAMTPDGVLVFADRPDLLPPVRPGTEAPPATVPLAEDAVAVGDAPDGVVLIAGAPALTPPVRPTPPEDSTAPADALALTDIPTDPAPEATAPEATTAEATAPEAPQADATDAVTPPETDEAAVVYLSERPALTPAIRPGTADDAAPGAPQPDRDDVVFITERPALVPAVRPAAPVPEAETPQADAEDTGAEIAALVQRPGPDTPRPARRPESLAPAAAPQPPEADPSLPALARDAPPSRPSELAPPAAPPAELAPEPDPAVQQAGAASLELNAALASAVAEAAARPNRFVDATPQAVVASVRPDARPRNMDRIVSAAVAQQQRQAVAEPVRPAATAQPSGPTSTTVARAATMENAINLRDVNLIGVFNRNDGRLALVRLSNGRLQEVRVGDRLDGGQVTAISDDALNYVKRGRTITLQIPSG